MKMLRDRRFWAGVGITVGIGLVVPLAVIELGIPNMSALPDPDPLESRVGPWLLERSRAQRAPTTANPFGDKPEIITAGLDHYVENCMPCHGGPGGSAAEFADGFHPPAPHLTVPRIQALSDGELFWTVKNGVKMTGMPGFATSHTDDEIWHIVAAVRALGHLTPEQSAMLAKPAEDEHHHHMMDMDGGGSATNPVPGPADDHDGTHGATAPAADPMQGHSMGKP